MGVLTITLVMDKTKGNGVLLTVQNDDDKITQTWLLDGTQIVTTVKGQQETSTITQKQDSIAIKCKTYTVDAETITQKSTKASDYESQDTMTIKSTKAMTIESQDVLSSKAMKDFSITSDTGDVAIKASASNVKVTATQNFEVAATMNAKLKGTAGATLESTAVTEIKGIEAKVTGNADINLNGPLSQVGGSGMTQVKGSMIMIG